MWQVHNAYNEIRYERRYPSGLIQGISSFKSFWKLNLCPDIIVCQVMIWVCDDDSSCILVSFLVTLELDIMYIVTLQLLWYIVMSLDNILLPRLRWKIDRENWYIYIKKVSLVNCSHHHLKADVSSVIFINLLYLMSNL